LIQLATDGAPIFTDEMQQRNRCSSVPHRWLENPSLDRHLGFISEIPELLKHFAQVYRLRWYVR
jgi:hypothetical protein